MIFSQLVLAITAVASTPALDAAQEQARQILAKDDYGFCHDPKYPLTDTEAGWCPPVGPEKNPRCPAFRSACDAPRAVLQDLGRLNFSRGGDGGDTGDGGDQDATKDDPGKDDKPGTGDKSGKRKQPKREVDEEPEYDMPELGGLGYVLFWVILGGGVLLLVIVIIRNSTQHKEDKEPPVEPPEAELGAIPASTGPSEQLVRDVDALLEQARSAASAGDYNRAIQRAHAALLHRLDHDGLIRVAPFRTNGDYVRDLAQQPDLRSNVRQIVRDVELVQFGTARADAGLYERVLQRIIPIATRRSDVLALLLTVSALFSCDPTKSYPFDRSPSGANAVVELGAAYGLEIDFRSTALADIDPDEKLGTGETGRTLVLLHDAPHPTAHEWDRLLEWAENGHHLVIAGTTPPSDLNVTIVPGAPGHDLTVSDGLDYGALDVITADTDYLVRGDLEGRPLLEFSDASIYAIQYERGYLGGDVTVFADDRLFTGGALMLRQNPEFLIRFLKGLGASEIELADGLLDLGADTPAEAIANTHLTPVVLQILALMALLFLWKGTRFGRPRDPPSRSRRHFSEHIEALGTQYARARASRHALRLYSAWALERLREKTQSTRTPGLYPLAQAIAGRTGDDENRVMETLAEASSLSGDAGDPRIAYARGAARKTATTDNLRLMQDLARLVRLVGGPR